MNKNQGFAAGLVVAATLMLRSVAPSSAPDAPPSAAASDANAPQAPTETRDGPWIASCNYWAPVRPASPPPRRDPEISGTIDSRPVDLHLNLPDSGKQERGCVVKNDTGKWGFPDDFSQIQVTALIAVVPDPVHTHLGLTFDRTMDALLQAGSDNGYPPSYFWLPWKSRGSVLKTAESPSDAEPGHDPDRERQPGLIILKSAHNFNEVIYLFVVGETVTEGVDGTQLQNAFQYESELQSALKGHFTTGKSGSGKSRVSIVGPTLSGSAASLRAAIDSAARISELKADEFHIAGSTYAAFPVQLLTRGEKSSPPPPPAISYLSFGYDSDYITQTFLGRLGSSRYDLARVALLIEDNTTYASNLIESAKKEESKSGNLPLTIRFPREISSLRNAASAADQSGSALPGNVSPYLRFSVKDYSSTRESIPAFSRELTPLSQEAQLMTIARQLHRNRTQFVVLNGNVLDVIFLAQFLHRACPETTLVFSGDLLTVREIDSEPFVGSISIGPYPLIGLGRPARPKRPVRTQTSATSYAYYNAASYTLWENGLHEPIDTLPPDDRFPPLEGYRNLLLKGAHQPPLWATVVGNDGYYPLGILSPCSRSTPGILPRIEAVEGREGEVRPEPQVCKADTAAIPQVIIYPSRFWGLCCLLITAVCMIHAFMLQVATYWSPLSRDLAVGDNDLPRRRTSYIHVATGMLVTMALVVAFPILRLAEEGAGNPLSTSLARAALVAALLAVCSTLSRTRRYLRWERLPPEPLAPETPAPEPPGTQRRAERAYEAVRRNFYLFVNLLLLVALAGIAGLWAYSCSTGSSVGDSPALAGLSFSFRSVNPGTGVSPLPPVLLLLSGWFIWALMQARRLRFSEAARPKLPRKLHDRIASRLFLSDDELSQCGAPLDCCLYNNISCLMIGRQMLRRFLWSRRLADPAAAALGPESQSTLGIDMALALFGGLTLAVVSLFSSVRYIDHFLWNTGPGLSSPYEFLVIALLSTLVAVCIAGWLRMIAIWNALRRGVLERLENMPLRFAFSRLKGMGWMTMLRQGGLEQQWRDLSRSLESMGYICHQPDLPSDQQQQLRSLYDGLMSDVAEFREPIRSMAVKPPKPDYELLRSVEERVAEFSRLLLSFVLIPYWQDERIGLVEHRETVNLPEPDPTRPPRVLAAEEFLAIRYVSLITAVLANLRYLMTFVSVTFVLALLAWNSSSFQPRQLLDWFFTGLLAILGAGVIAVFAQMHRNALLSRITDTQANELGWDFYFRTISFGVLPVLTWVAYQFPAFGSMIYRFIEPAVPVIK